MASMSKSKRAKRRAYSMVLHTAAGMLEAGWHLIGSLLDENEAVVVVREGPLKHALTEQEVRILDVRRKRLYALAQEIRKVARHLWRTSR